MKIKYEIDLNKRRPQVGDWCVVLPEDSYYSNAECGIAQYIYRINPSAKQFNWNVKYNDSYGCLPYYLTFSEGDTNQYHCIRRATTEEIRIAKELYTKNRVNYEDKV